MASRSSVNAALRQLHVHALATCSDAELLDRFIDNGDERAFEAILNRHGPMLLTQCRRWVGNEHLAEEVVQAAFLVLARKSRSLKKRDSLASWLFGAAQRIAIRARLSESTRKNRERKTAPNRQPAVDNSAGWNELLRLLDEELRRLPEECQAPLILCYLEGRTQDEAAKHLGVSLSTLRRRLDAGRERLKARMIRRGATLGASLFAGFLAPGAAQAMISAELRQAILSVLHVGTNGVTIPATVIALASGGLHMTTMTKFCAVTVMLLTVGSAVWTTKALTGEVGGRKAMAQETAQFAKEPSARLDQLGDPLPEHAVMKLGTTRLYVPNYANVQRMIFTPDGKTLLANERARRMFGMWDASNGRELQMPGLSVETMDAFALSPDGKTLVTAHSEREKAELCVWDFASRKVIRKVAGAPGITSDVLFGPSGKTIATITDDAIRLLSTSTLEEVKRFPINEHGGRLAFLGNDNTLLAVTGLRNKQSTLRWLDIEKGQEVHRLAVPIRFPYRFEASPDGKLLAVRTTERLIRLLDAQTGKTTHEIEIPNQEKSVSYWDLCFTPDSKTLVCSGGDQKTGYATIFFATDTGKELTRWEEDRRVGGLAFAPDGTWLAQVSADVFRYRDARTGADRFSVPYLPAEIQNVCFTSDDKTLVAGLYRGLTFAADAFTGKQIEAATSAPVGMTKEIKTLLHQVAISPDGSRAAAISKEGIHIWETATGKVFWKISEPAPMEYWGPRFHPDGKTLMVLHADQFLRFWDIDTHEIRQSIAMHEDSDTTRIFGYYFTISRDGQTLAASSNFVDIERRVRLWDADSGKELGQLRSENPAVRPHAITSDGRYLVSEQSQNAKDPRSLLEGPSWLRVWDVSTKRIVRDLIDVSQYSMPGRLVAFSPDDKTFATTINGSGSIGNKVRLFELATGNERGVFSGHLTAVNGVAFSHNGRMLATGSADKTAMTWDITTLSPDGQWSLRDTSPEDLARHWSELAGDDAANAYRAMWSLAAAKQGPDFLAKKLQPVAKAEAEKINRLIADLDSEQFGVRAKASQELQDLAELAEPGVRKVLAGNPSPESRVRLEEFIKRIETNTFTPDQLRFLRAIEALENAGTVEARRLLETIAGGAAEARMTRVAQSSLGRLAKKQGA